MKKELLNKLITNVLLITIIVTGSTVFSLAETTKTVGNSGDYANIKSAVDAINAGNLTGEIILQIVSDITESEFFTLNASGSGDASYTSILIYPTDAPRTISTTQTQFFRLNGSDNVTIDGRVDLSGTSQGLTIIGTTSYTFFFMNSAQNNTIRYCNIQGGTTSNSGGIIYFYTSGGNNNNIIEYNNITNNGTRPTAAAIYSEGSSSLTNSGNIIRYNNIYDFFPETMGYYGSYGIYMKYSTDFSIIGNSFYETTDFVATDGYSNTNEYCVIKIEAYSYGDNFIITDNYIGGQASACGGSAWAKTGYGRPFYGIKIKSSADNNANNIQGNVIKNISWDNDAAANWYAVSVEDGNLNIGNSSGNTIGVTSGTSSIELTNGNFYGIHFDSYGGTINCQNNNIGGIKTNNSNSTSASSFYGIYLDDHGGATILNNNTIGSSTTENSIYTSSASTSMAQYLFGIYTKQKSSLPTINNNIIAHLTNGTTNTSTSTYGTVTAIFNLAYTSTITNNTIHDLKISNANTWSGVSTSGYYPSIMGIGQEYSGTSSTPTTIEGNEIYNLTNDYASFTGSVTGISIYDFDYNCNIGRNFIHDFSVNSSAVNSKMYGILMNSSRYNVNLNVVNNIISLGANSSCDINGIQEYFGQSGEHRYYYFNTINIYGSMSSGSAQSNAFASGSTNNGSLSLYNNIFTNTRNNTGDASGAHAAIRVSSSQNNHLASNYNDYYTPGEGGATGYYGSTEKTTMIDWMVASGQDMSSKNINPVFTDATGSEAEDYVPSETALMGIEIETVTTDYNEDARTYNSMGAFDYEVGNLSINVSATAGTNSGTYENLKEVFDAINDGTHQGAIEVALGASTTETATCILNASGNGSANYSSVLIYPTVTGTSIGGAIASAPLIDLNGADNVTFDGRVNTSGNQIGLSIFNTDLNSLAVIRFREGAQDNTVKYCTIRNNRASSGGSLYFATSSNGANSGNMIEYCTITGLNATTRPLRSVYSNGSASPNNNTDNTIQNNYFEDFFYRGSETNVYGIYLGSGSTDWSIIGNSFYETTEFTPSYTSYFQCIYIYNTSDGNNFTISNNYFGGSAPQCQGDPWTKTAASDNPFYAIRMSAASTTASNIQGNTITNFDWYNAGSSGSRHWRGIDVGGGSVNIGTNTANIIGSASGNDAIKLTGGGATLDFYGMYISGTTINCKNNIIGGITTASTDPTQGVNLYGIYIYYCGSNSEFSNNTIGNTSTANSLYASSTATAAAQQVFGMMVAGPCTINNNTIANLTNNTTNTTTSTQGTVTGIFSKQYDLVITNNVIYDLKIYNANTEIFSNPSHGSYTYGSAGGIITTQVDYKIDISENTIYNISNLYSNFSGEVIGINFSGFHNNSADPSTVSGNFVRGLFVHTSSSNANIYGIKLSQAGTLYSGPKTPSLYNNIITITGDAASNIYGIFDPGTSYRNSNIYFNSIYIDGSPTNGSNNTYALYSGGNSSTRNYRDNILVNARSNNGANGKHYAAYFNYSSSSNLTLDYNDYYVSGTGGVLGYYNSSDVSSLPLVTGQDVNSQAVDPEFVQGGGTQAMDYLPETNLLNTGIAIANVTVDYSGVTRESPPSRGALEQGISWTGATSSDWNTTSNWSNNAVPSLNQNIVISTSDNDPVIASTANAGGVYIQTGASLTVNSGASLITTGDFDNNGTINIQKSIANDAQWHFIAAPTTNAKASIFNGMYLQKWDETSKAWLDITDPDESLSPAKGYSLWSPDGAKGNFTFTGTPNTGNQSISLSYHDNSVQNDGANLVGNPYPSYLDWDQVSGYGSKYTWDGSVYKAYTQTGSYGTGSRYVAPMEGFFVVTASSGSILTLTNDMRTHTSAKKDATALAHGIVLTAGNENYSDALFIVFDEAANESFELPRDAWKFISGTAGVSQLWSECPDGNLAVDVRPETECIQLGFTNNEAGTYAIGIKEIADINTAILEDTKINIFHKLTEGDYSFDWDLNDDETRFKLHLNTTAVDEISDNTVQVYVAGGNIIIQSEIQPEHISLTDITGRTLGVWVDVENIPAPETEGVYLVTVESENKQITKKIIIE